MAGRDSYPGEDTTGFMGTRDGPRYLSRIVRGQFASVDPPNGKAQISTLEVHSSADVTVPSLWFSGKGRQSAWGRYMPFGGENIHIAYRNNDSPVVVGYDMNAGGEEQPQEGWQQLKKFADDGIAGFAVFRELRPGEFDFKSSGDAYIHGSNQGTLYLSGGQAFIKLNKQAYRLESKASEYHYLSETSEMRFGTVFRKEKSTDQDETPASAGIFKEFLVDINFPLPIGTPSSQSRAKIHFGDILDSSNIQELSPNGFPLRTRISLGDGSDTIEVFSLLIDNMGNINIEQSQASSIVQWKTDQTTIDINGPLGEFFISLSGAPSVAVAIADHLQTLWTEAYNKMAVFDTHIHPTGVGPSGPPTPLAQFPAWNSAINSSKLNIPDG